MDTTRGGKHAAAVDGIMDGMDPDDLAQARDVLARLLALIDAGELDADGAQVAALRGALTALEGVDTPPSVQ